MLFIDIILIINNNLISGETINSTKKQIAFILLKKYFSSLFLYCMLF